MNQSTAIKQSTELSVSGQSNRNIISLSKVRIHQKSIQKNRINMIKQRLIGLVLLVISLIVWLMTNDLTVVVFLVPFYGTMIFSRKYIMQFNKKR